jgi:MYXO-CTERM domain-containing protein
MRQDRNSRCLLAALTALALTACTGLEGPVPTDQLGEQRLPIVNGTLDTAHPAIGVLHSGNAAACTATLVGKRTVVTAAHCVTNDSAPYQQLAPVNFYVGGLNGTKYSAVAVAFHPGYAGGNQSDIAVVRLGVDVQGVQPIPVATSAPTLGEAILLVGYGQPTPDGIFGVKRKAPNIIAKLSSTLVTYLYNGNPATGITCKGDSGSPVLAVRGGVETLIAVHSTGDCGSVGNGMRVDAFYNWVAAQAQGDLSTVTLDKEPPKVTILQPTASAVLGPDFVVNVLAQDDVGVIRVNLFVNGVKHGERTTSPFSFQLQGIAQGTHTIEAVALDDAGHSGSAAHTVSVQDSAPPSTAKPFGAACQAATECHSNLCLSGPSGQFCSATCTESCPSGFACQGGVCLPQAAAPTYPPGAAPYGAACATNADCGSRLCALDSSSGRRFCTTLCDLTQDTCPTGNACHPVDDGRAICGPLHDLDADEEALDGGCSLATTGGRPALPGWPLLGLLLLGLWRRRSRRPNSSVSR